MIYSSLPFGKDFNFFFNESRVRADTTSSGRSFHKLITRWEKKFYLTLVLHCILKVLVNYPYGFYMVIGEKKISWGVLYRLCIYLYTWHIACSCLQVIRLERQIGSEHSFRHLPWTFSNSVISFWYHGLHKGDTYSNTGHTRLWYKILTSLAPRLVKQHFIKSIY